MSREPATTLRTAAQALDPDRVVSALAATLAEWGAPQSHWRERLCDELAVWAPANVELGLRDGLRGWTRDALRDLREHEVTGHARAPGLTAVWLASTVPPGVLSALVLPLLAGSAVHARTSVADPVTARLFAESLAATDPGVGSALRVTSGVDPLAGSSLLATADAVVAYGNDETVAAVRARVPVHCTFVGHGHRLSVAAIGREAALGRAVEAAALDLALWDGRGCLSPAYVLVDDAPAGRALDVARALAAELERLRTKLPRGERTAAEETALRELRARLALGSGSGSLLSPTGSEWGVLLTPQGIRPSPGTLRNVPLVPVSGLDGLAAWCDGLAPHLSTVGHAGWGDDARALPGLVARAGGSRICPLGRMQLPPIDWNHDGLGALRPLLRFVDVEDPT